MPEIKPTKELRFRSPNGKLALRTQMFRPATNADFVTTQGSVRRDVGFFSSTSTVSGQGISNTSGSFYLSNAARNFQLGDPLYISNSANKDVIIVHLDGPTTVS